MKKNWKLKSLSVIVSLVMIITSLSMNCTQVEALDGAVAQVGDNTYSTLQDAFDIGGKVKLLADVKLTATVKIKEGTTVDFDLNGHEITVSQSGGRSLYAIDNYGTFTLNDTSSSNSGKIIARGVENYGTMTMIGGTIDSCDSNGGGAAVWNEADFIMTGGTLQFSGKASGNSAGLPFNNAGGKPSAKITGGNLISEYTSVMASVESTLELSNVTLAASTEYWNAVKIFGGTQAKFNNVTINSSYGGGVEVTDNSIADFNNCTFNQTKYYDHNSMNVAVSDGGTANIYSGTYTSENYGLYVFNSGGTINVFGGTFKAGKAVLKTDTLLSEVNISNGVFDGKWIINDGTTLKINKGSFVNTEIEFEDFKNNYVLPVGKYAIVDEDNDLLYIVGNATESLDLESEEIRMEKGQNQQLKLTVNPEDSLEEVTWTTADADIAEVSKTGIVTAKKAGVTSIEIKSGYKYAYAKISVYEVKAPDITVDTSEDTDINVDINKETTKTIEEETSKIVSDVINDGTSSNVSEETKERILEAVDEGKQIKISLEVKPIVESELSNEDKSLVQTAVTKDTEIAQFLDINAYIMSDTDVLGKVEQFSKKLTIKVEISEELIIPGRNFSIIRVHDGVAEKLETTLDGTALTFETDKFSTYALAYEDKQEPEETEKPEEPDVPSIDTDLDQPSKDTTTDDSNNDTPVTLPKEEVKEDVKDDVTKPVTTNDNTVMSQYVISISIAMIIGYIIIASKKKENI